MKIIYQADDGTLFDDECECKSYEFNCNNEIVKSIKLYDQFGELLKTNFFDNEVYESVWKIVIPQNYNNDKEIRKIFEHISDITGYMMYSEITSTGTWVIKEKARGDLIFVKE